MPPKYHSNNVYRVFEDDVPSLPDAYGSRQDTRAGTITQLHDNTIDIPIVDPECVNDTIRSILPADETYKTAPDEQLFQYTVNVSQDSSQGFPFKARSIRIDNYTNQFLFLLPMRIHIPPDFFGIVLSGNGIQQLTVTFQPPGTLVQPAPTAGTVVEIIAYFEEQQNVAGTRRL